MATARPVSKCLFIGLAAGGLLIFSCMCLGISGYLGYKLAVPPNIVALWENEFGGDVYEFRADGTGRFDTKFAGSYIFKYHFVNYSDLVLTFPPPAKDAQLRMEVLRYQVSYFHDKMQWEDLDHRGFYTNLRRVR